MFIVIECDRNKTDISNIELGDNFLNFSLLHSFRIQFKDEDEARDFFINLFKQSEKRVSINQSHIEMDDSLTLKMKPTDTFVQREEAKPRAIRMYRIFQNPVKNCLEIDFYLDSGNISFFIYQDMIDDIKGRLM